MRFSQLPLCSSEQIVAALKRLGAYQGQSEVPKGTLRGILQGLDIPLEDFIDALR